MDLEARVKRLEDRSEIIEKVIRYAIALDRRDWNAFTSLLTDEIFIDFSEWSGMEPRMWAVNEWAEFARTALNGFAVTQHISPNHVVTIEGDDATCISYMYAQHNLPGASGGDTLIMRGYYTNIMKRTPAGWKISKMKQHLTWAEGNEQIFDSARARFEQSTNA